MHARAGSSFLLSVLIIVLAAVALYRPDAPPPTLATPSPAARAPTPVGPEPTAGVPIEPTAPIEPAPAREPRPASSRVGHEPFARVESGETLADVARRVYGDAAAADRIFAANRDELRTPADSLPAGMLLRTP